MWIAAAVFGAKWKKNSANQKQQRQREWYGFSLLQNNKYYNLIWKIYVCVLFARNHWTALESPHHLSANNWLHIIELLELRELIIIIWHTVQPLHHILLPNDLWKFCSLYNQHHTIWSQATPHHQRHDMHVPKCTYSSENTEPVLPVVACEWMSTHTTNTNI